MHQLSLPLKNAPKLKPTSTPVSRERMPTNTTANRHAVHRWFNFIAGFAPEFVAEQCIEFRPGSVLLDPFAGCGTSLVEAQALGVHSVGFEPHPFFARIARAKTAQPWTPDDLAEFQTLLLEALESDIPLPKLTDSAEIFLNKLFDRPILEKLLRARVALQTSRWAEDDLAFLMLSRVIDLCSRAQTDGIYKAPTSTKRAAIPSNAICSVVQRVSEDSQHEPNTQPVALATIYMQSSEMMDKIPSKSIDVVVTSPPYLNNFDFAEMTRMYLYFWGMCESWKDITETVRSKLIVNTTTSLSGHRELQDQYRNEVCEAIRPQLDELVNLLRAERRVRAGKKEYDLLVYPYFAQMTRVLKEAHRCLKNGGKIHVVVADAAFYGIHVSAPQFLAMVMKDVGFRNVQCVKMRERGHRWSLEKRDGSPVGLGEYHLIAEVNEATMTETVTLYQIADAEIRRCIEVYLDLANISRGLTDIRPEHLEDPRAQVIVMAGLGVPPRGNTTPVEVFTEWQRRQAIAFDLETGITAGVYTNLRNVAERFYTQLEEATDGLKSFEPAYLVANSYLLPILQHLAGIFSKANLKKLVGSVSDTGISKPAAERLAKLLQERVDPALIVKGEILKRVESTLEGIVRDLVGRVLLESIVDAALRKRELMFLREEDYPALPGVVYDFRADFLLPTLNHPLVFIEVRKSSSRHASLYAKDKMFSAINWKGKNKDLLAVLVVDGEWTNETLRVMANVFDYVVPIGRIEELVDSIEAYLNGDHSKLKWLIDFKISPAQGSQTKQYPEVPSGLNG